MAEGKVGETLTFKHGLHGLRESWGNLDIYTWSICLKGKLGKP